MILHLNAKHVPEVREITTQLAKQSEEQAAFREKSKAVQSAHAGKIVDIKDWGERVVAPWSIHSSGVQVYRGRGREELSSRFIILFSTAWSAAPVD